jgi:hypothetical protein
MKSFRYLNRRKEGDPMQANNSDKERGMYKHIVRVALQGIALAMGVAVVVMSTLNTLDVSTGVSMLGFGLAAIALAGFQQ